MALVALIRRDIMAGILKPGSRLRIKALSERYGAGLTPLREALARLSASGLIVAEDQRGSRVAPVSPAELHELLALRKDLESTALRESIAKGSLEWEAQLIAAHHRLMRRTHSADALSNEASNYEEEWNTVHREFHMALLGACESHWLMQFVRILFDQMIRYRHLSLYSPGSGDRDIPTEHQGLLDAAIRRDADAACALLQDHMSKTAELALRAMADIEARNTATSAQPSH